jgi:hypothetical protein
MEASIVRKFLNYLVLVLLFTSATAVSSRAQDSSEPTTSQPLAGSSASRAATSSTNQGIVSSLSNLPDADTLIYINPQRILNEVLPKFMPPKDLEQMRKGFEEARTKAGVDPTKVDYIVLAVRFKKPTAALNFQPPEALVVASGDFSADSLMVLARMASQGKLRDEKYGNKTLGLMTIDPMVKEAEKSPLLKAFTEVGVVPLNANTIALGTPGYLRAAIDAGDGKDRISAETLNSLVRDTSVLMSVSGRPWHSFAKSFGMLGTEAADRAARCDSKMGDFYAALTMDTTNFMLRGAMNEDNPDTAKIISNLFNMLMGHATSSMKDPAAQSLLKNFVIAAEGDEVILRGDFPQQMVMELMKQKMSPKKDEAAAGQKDPAKPAVKRRRVRRRAKP